MNKLTTSLLACLLFVTASAAQKPSNYSVVLLGDTHFDTAPASVYHSDYKQPDQHAYEVQTGEFARNAKMWADRCPRMISRAVRLVGKDTRMVFQMGDLVQGDCGNPDVHRRMLSNMMDYLDSCFNGLPVVTVTGNHDVRGTGAGDMYRSYMPGRLTQELGMDIRSTTFGFNIGPDLFIFVDFNHPDDAEIERLLSANAKARHTFIISHGPILPYDGSKCRWIFHGKAREDSLRRHFRQLFAERDAIVLCGHVHTTEFADWIGDGGRITQLTLNSVWAKEEQAEYILTDSDPARYGKRRAENVDDSEESLFDEYRPGLVSYSRAKSAGSYKLTVKGKHVWVDFYPGDSETPVHRFEVR